MLQYESLRGVNGSLNWLCNVLLRCNKVAAMPELADVATLSPCIRIQLMITFNVKVFPVPPGASKKISLPLPFSLTLIRPVM